VCSENTALALIACFLLLIGDLHRWFSFLSTLSSDETT
jgi:hypothetical protein